METCPDWAQVTSWQDLITLPHDTAYRKKTGHPSSHGCLVLQDFLPSFHAHMERLVWHQAQGCFNGLPWKHMSLLESESHEA